MAQQTAPLTRTAPVPARGKLHGMKVVFKTKGVHNHAPNEGHGLDCVEYPRHGGGLIGACLAAAPVWTVLDRHPARGHWWLHRRDALGAWVTTFARYSDLEQVIE